MNYAKVTSFVFGINAHSNMRGRPCGDNFPTLGNEFGFIFGIAFLIPIDFIHPPVGAGFGDYEVAATVVSMIKSDRRTGSHVQKLLFYTSVAPHRVYRAVFYRVIGNGIGLAFQPCA